MFESSGVHDLLQTNDHPDKDQNFGVHRSFVLGENGKNDLVDFTNRKVLGSVTCNNNIDKESSTLTEFVDSDVVFYFC